MNNPAKEHSVPRDANNLVVRAFRVSTIIKTMNRPARYSAWRVGGVIPLFLLAISMLLSSCASVAGRFDALNVHTWKIEDGSNFFPEMDDPRVSVPWLTQRPSFGIAFSGGGTRSATASLGQLRALKMLGWIDRARYLSANSGGSWTALPFVYLPSDMNEDVFLGPYVPPENINDSVLKPPTDTERDRLSMSSAIYRSKIGKHFWSLRRGDEAYANVIGKIFLNPFKLHDRSRLFTFHDKALASILEHNTNLEKDDFYVVQRQRPYPVIVGSLRVPVVSDAADRELYLVEATPLYTGVRQEFEVLLSGRSSIENTLVGGGYVESFGYDSYEPNTREPDNGVWKVRLKAKLSRGDLLPGNKRYRFTLSDVIGMSGAAPAITFKDIHIPFDIFPEFRHWAIDRSKVTDNDNLRDKAKELTHGDGGDIDNLALMPLLARKVDNILTFINTRTAFPKDADCDEINTDIMVDDLIALFRPIGKLTHNVVIDDAQGAKLKSLCRAFTERKAQGQPLVYCDRYAITDNPRQSVSGDAYQPVICWIYLDRTEQWISKLNGDGGKQTRDLRYGEGDFDKFPHYATFSEKKGLLIDLDRERVHALSNLSAWTVLVSKDYLAEQLAGALSQAGR